MFAAREAAGSGASAEGWEVRFRRAPVPRSHPLDQLQAMKRARAAGLDIVGVYHTHPDHPAEPSAYDRDTAAPEWSYVIASVRKGKVADVRSWCVRGPGGRLRGRAGGEWVRWRQGNVKCPISNVKSPGPLKW